MARPTGFPFISEVNTDVISEMAKRMNTKHQHPSSFIRMYSNASVDGPSGGDGFLLMPLSTPKDMLLESQMIFEPIIGKRNVKNLRVRQHRYTPGAGINSTTIETTGDNNMLFKAIVT